MLRWKVVTGFFYPPVLHIAPSSVSCADSYGLRCFALDCIELSPGQFDPRGEAYVLCCVEDSMALVIAPPTPP